MVFSNNLLAGAGGQATGYEIDQSIRFNDEDSARLARTIFSSGSLTTWTTSVWVKRGKHTVNTNGQWFPVFSASAGGTAYDSPLNFTDVSTGGFFSVYIAGQEWRTSQKAVDIASWYHIVTVWDSNNGTAGDRMRLYINGERVTDFQVTGSASSGLNSQWNSSSYSHHRIGNLNYNGGETTYVFDGYLAEINFIDGTALDPTSFGETNADTGQWVPVKYTGSYGTNGFYITGEDSTFLGQDVRTSGDQVNSFQASQWTGATGSYTFSDGRIEADTDNKAIKSVDTFTGDFEFSWRYVNMANFIIGFYEIDEDGTFSDSSSAGNMQNMTDSWYVQTSSVAANRDIFYGGAVQVNATTIANGDTWKMARESGTIKVYRNGSVVHTFSQTSTNEVRLVVAQGDASADANQVNWVDNSTLGNNFFSSGLSTADQVTDTPTNNFATWNPLIPLGNGSFSDGNLQFTQSGGSISQHAKSTISFTSGEKKVCEMQTVSGSSITLGICDEDFIANNNGFTGDSRGYFDTNGNKIDSSGNGSSYGASFGTSNVIRIEVDLSSNPGTIEFFKDGVSQGDAFTDIDSTKTWFFWCRCKADAVKANFGQLGFAGTPTSGFTALNTFNMPDLTIADPADQFDIGLWAGNDTDGRAITGYNFQPDWVWIKSRSGDYSHSLTDAVRGAGVYIQSNTADAEVAGPGAFGSTLAFTSNGFTLDNGTSDNLYVNAGGETYVGWAWKANGSGSSNGDGSVTSTVSNNSTANFSIVKYTGTGSGNSTVGHGLGVTPDMIICKHLDRGQNWRVFHTSAGVGKTGFLNTTDNFAADPDRISAVSSTTFTAAANMNESADYIAYCFADVEGFSKFGGYEGNGSTDGPFVYTGFKPRWIMFRRYDGADGWSILDTARGSGNFGSAAGSSGKDPTAGNEMNNKINANDQYGEEDNSGGSRKASFLSNGFKVKNTNTAMNASGGDYLYMAFAESPFKTATAR